MPPSTITTSGTQSPLVSSALSYPQNADPTTYLPYASPQIITSSGTWRHPKPGFPISVSVRVVGGGGGGGGSENTSVNGSGGGGSGRISSLTTITLTDNVTVTIGAGGAGLDYMGGGGGYAPTGGGGAQGVTLFGPQALSGTTGLSYVGMFPNGAIGAQQGGVGGCPAMLFSWISEFGSGGKGGSSGGTTGSTGKQGAAFIWYNRT